MTINYTHCEIENICVASEFDFDAKGRLLLFVGHAHSGHSLIGALLDAHPDVCLTNEVNVVKLIQQYQLNKEQIEKVLFHAYASNQIGWKNSAYKYNLKGGFQGMSDKPEVLGDKKAGGSTRIIFNHPEVYDDILKLYGDRLRVIYVERNPLDVVAAYSYYMQQEPSLFHVNRYNENKAVVEAIQLKTPAKQWLTIKQNAFVNEPYNQLMSAYDFIGVSTGALITQIQDWVSVVKSDIKGKSESIEINDNLKALINYN